MCDCLAKAEEKLIGEYKDKVRCEFGTIETTSREGITTKHGWGVNFFRYDEKNDRAIVFGFCPWCGKRIEEETGIDKEKEA